MNEDTLKSVWSRGGHEIPLGKEDLDRIVAGGLERGSKVWASYVYIHLAALVATIVFAALNVLGYSQNHAMLAAQVGVGAIALAALPVGVHVLRQLARIDRGDEPIIDALRRRLRFYTTIYEVWLWVAGLTMALLVFVVTTYIDNQGGQYPINKPWVFWGTLAGIVVFIYATGKLSSYPVVREMCDALLDLQEGTTERIERVPQLRRRWLRWRLVMVVVMAMMAILGVLASLAVGS